LICDGSVCTLVFRFCHIFDLTIGLFSYELTSTVDGEKDEGIKTYTVYDP